MRSVNVPVDSRKGLVARQGAAWRIEWKRRIRSVNGLHRHLARRGIAPVETPPDEPDFPVRVTPYYAGLIRKADASDPIYRQCAPAPDEFRPGPARRGQPDPFGETGLCSPTPGVIRRYHNRAVVLVSADCAVHCRHCTRRHSLRVRRPVAGATDVLAWLRRAPDVREIILSGGDPFALSTARLADLLDTLKRVPHVRRLRIGTRMPVTLPHRVTPALVAALARHHPLWVATHFNHPAELTPEAAAACARLADAGLSVVNQTVLLRGVNDRVSTLHDLFEGLVDLRVRPYYLLHCDPVAGAMHFRVPIRTGLDLMRRVRARTSGLAMPVYAADKPGASGKVPLYDTPGRSSRTTPNR